jgi:hypothetical protein
MGIVARVIVTVMIAVRLVGMVIMAFFFMGVVIVIVVMRVFFVQVAVVIVGVASVYGPFDIQQSHRRAIAAQRLQCIIQP